MSGPEAPLETGTRRAVVLRIAGERYAIPAERVEELIEQVELSTMGALPAHAAGVVRHRGAWVPAIDPAPLLGSAAASTPRSAAILRRGGERYALLSEELCGILDVDPATLRDTGLAGAAPRFAMDDEGAILLLDTDALFTTPAPPARPRETTPSSAPHTAVLAFRAGGFELALPVAEVVEVRSSDALRRTRARGLAGFVARGGATLPVIDLAARIGASRSEAGMLVVVRAHETEIALLVDAVAGVLSGVERPLPALLHTAARPGLRALLETGGTLRTLLDPPALLDAEELRAFASAAARATRARSRRPR